MPGRRVSLRPTVYLRLLNQDGQAAAAYGTFTEYVIQGLGVFTNLWFVVGTICFFEKWGPPLYSIGVWCFIGASILHTTLSIFQTWESWSARKRHEAEMRNETAENILYILAGVCYCIGSILWLPLLYQGNEMALVLGHAVATWFFIWGSFALVIASYWNTIGMVETSLRYIEHPRISQVRRYASVALCFTALGGSLFVAGSFLFRPGFKNECEMPGSSIKSIEERLLRGLRPVVYPPVPLRSRHQHVLGPSSGDDYDLSHAADMSKLGPLCTDIITQGTWLFLWGSTCFLIQSLLSLGCTITLHGEQADLMRKSQLPLPIRQEPRPLASKGAGPPQGIPGLGAAGGGPRMTDGKAAPPPRAEQHSKAQGRAERQVTASQAV